LRFAAAALVGLAGCAQVGPVLPPSAGLPRPVEDFAARRSGAAVELRWTPPHLTSDGVAWRGPLRYNLCSWPGLERGRRPAPSVALPGTVPAAPQIPSPPPRVRGGAETPSGAIMPACPRLLHLGAAAPGVTVPLPGLGGGGSFATLALYALNAQGQGAGWSNAAVVALTPVGPPPSLTAARATADGVALRWTPPAPPLDQILIYRDGTLLARLPSSTTAFLDRSIAWKQRYQYWLRSGAGAGAAAVESPDSRHLPVSTADVFPPPVPTGLQAVAGPAGVDLSWNAVVAHDLAGYNVYRQLPGASAWEKRNPEPLPTPVFHDAAAPGATYAVTALDAAGNESQRSAPAVAH